MRWATATLVLSAALQLGACSEYRDPSVPAFRVAPFGAGVELSTDGRAVRWLDGSGNTVATFRTTPTAVRAYDALSVREGRMLASEGGFRVVDREGSELCEVAIDEGSGQAAIACANGQQFAIERVAEGVVVRSGSGAALATMRAAVEGSGVWLEQDGEVAQVVDEGSGVWAVITRDQTGERQAARIESSRQGGPWAAAVALSPAVIGDQLALRGALGWVLERIWAIRPAD